MPYSCIQIPHLTVCIHRRRDFPHSQVHPSACPCGPYVGSESSDPPVQLAPSELVLREAPAILCWELCAQMMPTPPLASLFIIPVHPLFSAYQCSALVESRHLPIRPQLPRLPKYRAKYRPPIASRSGLPPVNMPPAVPIFCSEI